MVIHFAAPSADADEFLEVMKSLEQTAREEMDPSPNEQDDYCAKNGTMIVGREGLAKDQVGKPEKLGKPGQ